MEIKITGAEKSTYWYAGLIGKTFKVIRRAGDEHGYKVAHHDPADPPETGYYVGESDCVIVSEVPTNITVLKDDSLGGIELEYREVKRKARAGERIKIVDAHYASGHYENGDIYLVTRLGSDGDTRFTGRKGSEFIAYPYEYVVLEPSDIVRIASVRFRMVDRKAAVGERVIIINDRIGSGGLDGKYFRVGDTATNVRGDRFRFNDGESWHVSDKAYRVLDPLENAEAATTPEPLSAKPAPDQAAEIIAKLTTRVDALEKRVAALESPKSRPATDAAITYALAKLPRLKSPQEIRDDIVKRAKEDVSDLLDIGELQERTLPSDNPLYDDFYRVEFVVNAEKRTVVALLRPKYGDLFHLETGTFRVFKSIAKCAPGDVFNVWIGKAIALRRALGLEIPEEYVSAPNPTEVRVGDVAKIVGNDRTHHFEIGDVGRVIERVDNGEKYATIVGTKTNEERRMRGGYHQHVLDADYVVIDDSREDSAEPRKEVA